MNETKLNRRRGILGGLLVLALGIAWPVQAWAQASASVNASANGQAHAQANANEHAVSAGGNLGAGATVGAPLPEPATWLGLTTLGAAAVVFARKHRRRQAS